MEEILKCSSVPLSVCLRILSLSQPTRCCSPHLSTTSRSSWENRSPERQFSRFHNTRLGRAGLFGLYVTLHFSPVDREWKQTPRQLLRKRERLFRGWGLTGGHMQSHNVCVCNVGLIWNDSHLKWMWHGQTHHPGAQRSFGHHRETRSSQNNAVTQKLQIHTKPPAQKHVEMNFVWYSPQSAIKFRRFKSNA